MSFNLFLWIREGVKQSVLLGVSDAIETIGTPDDSDDINPQLLEFMRGAGNEAPAKSSGGGNRRKRLGRSLKELDPQASS